MLTSNLSLAGVGILQAVLYLIFIRTIDLYEREGFRYLLPVFIWGFTVAALFALIFNSMFAFTVSTVVDATAADFLTAVISAPIAEESIKGLSLLLIFMVAAFSARRRGALEFSGVMDGIVYGSAVGFGFSIAEDLLYFAQYGQETFVVRRIFGGFAHAAFTSLTGIGIGLIPWFRWNVLKVLLPVAGLAGAILLHAVFNFTATFFGPLAYVIEFFVLLGYGLVIIVSLAMERRTIRRELHEEVETGVVTSGEYEILPTYFRRRAYYLGLILRGKLSEWRAARRIHGAEVDLAFTRRLVRRSFAPHQEDSVERLRRRVAELRERASPDLLS